MFESKRQMKNENIYIILFINYTYCTEKNLFFSYSYINKKLLMDCILVFTSAFRNKTSYYFYSFRNLKNWCLQFTIKKDCQAYAIAFVSRCMWLKERMLCSPVSFAILNQIPYCGNEKIPNADQRAYWLLAKTALPQTAASILFMMMVFFFKLRTIPKLR